MDLVFIGVDDRPGRDVNPDHIGSKAANLSRLAGIGLRVPPAFVLGTAVCLETSAAGGRLSQTARAAVREGIARLERATRRQFGGRVPLLVSVRSSPPISMPGMLETLLNVGLTDTVTKGLLRATGNPSLVWDTSRRFAQSFAETVSGCPSDPFARTVDCAIGEAGVRTIDEMDPLTLRALAREMTSVARTLACPLPSDPYEQLEAAIEAVCRSWSSPRAIEYRRISHVDDASGTAVVVQAMVFGNAGAESGSGVGFTRNPSTGSDELLIDFLFNAQGEDVVSGRHRVTGGPATLSTLMPDIHGELMRAKVLLEAEFCDMQDFEFTVQDRELFFLQTRAGKRTAWAALHIAADLVRSGIIDGEQALLRLRAYDLDSIRRTRLALDDGTEPAAVAVPAGIGVATGAITFDCGRAEALAVRQPVILVRPDLSTEDLSGLAVAEGILTVHGGRTSHAAVVARHLGKVCLAGCHSLRVDEANRRCSMGVRTFVEGDVITLDGESGLIYAGAVPTVTERPEKALEEIATWRAAASRDPHA
jgi:pyruvate,orthophosphate dikinase